MQSLDPSTLFLVSFVFLLHLCSINAKVHDATFQPDYVLEATQQNVTINCQNRDSVAVNGSVPGPTVFLREGQTTWIRVYNRLTDQNFTLHWHGLAQRAAPFSDGAPLVSQWPIPPNQFFDYEIRPEIGDAGTYFYHSHVGLQQSTARGVLIVEDAADPPYDYDKDVVLAFGDFYAKDDRTIETGLLADPFKWSGEPLAVTIGGQSGNSSFANASDQSCAPFIIDVEPDKTYRLRVIGQTLLSLVQVSIESHSHLEVIEADGEYTMPAIVDYIQIAPGQRFSYLLKTKPQSEIVKTNRRHYWIRYETRDRPISVSGYALLRYQLPDAEDTLPSLLPLTPPVSLSKATSSYLEGTLQPLSADVQAMFPKLSEVTRTITIQVNQHLVTGNYINGTINGSLTWVQNGHSWQENVEAARNQPPYLVTMYTTGQAPSYDNAIQNGGFDASTRTFPALPGEVLDIVWLNNNGITGGFDFHPMHMHGEHYYDLGSGNGTYNAAINERRFEHFIPARRDTTTLYRYTKAGVPGTTAGWRAWRIRVTEDNVGAWMAHCHIAAHALMGMNTIFVFGNREDMLTKFPSVPYVNGYLTYGGSAYGNSTADPVVNHWYWGP